MISYDWSPKKRERQTKSGGGARVYEKGWNTLEVHLLLHFAARKAISIRMGTKGKKESFHGQGSQCYERNEHLRDDSSERMLHMLADK